MSTLLDEYTLLKKTDDDDSSVTLGDLANFLYNTPNLLKVFSNWLETQHAQHAQHAQLEDVELKSPFEFDDTDCVKLDDTDCVKL